MRGMNNCVVTLSYKGTQVRAEFKNGNTANKVNASLTTDNPFVQDAIEHDARFGKKIVLAHVYEEQRPRTADAAAGRPPRLMHGRASVSRSAAQERQETGQVEQKAARQVVKSVKNVNDAISWFLSQGEEIGEDTDIEQLRVKYNVSFPNLR